MVVDVLKDAVVVPSAAIQRGAQGNLVYVVRDDSTVALRPVTVGPTEGQLTAITTGLQLGERVITDGVDRIREGVKVEVIEPGGGRRGGGQGADPAKREEMRKKREPAKVEVEPKTDGRAPPAQPSPSPSPNTARKATRDDFRKSLEDMTPEQRSAAMKKRMESMTPEQREEFRKRREAGQGREASPKSNQ
jgi:membrane fusion protein, multidrug efflux system